MYMGTNDSLSGRQWKLGTSQLICKCISSVATSKWSAKVPKCQGTSIPHSMLLPSLCLHWYFTKKRLVRIKMSVEAAHCGLIQVSRYRYPTYRLNCRFYLFVDISLSVSFYKQKSATNWDDWGRCPLWTFRDSNYTTELCPSMYWTEQCILRQPFWLAFLLFILFSWWFALEKNGNCWSDPSSESSHFSCLFLAKKFSESIMWEITGERSEFGFTIIT